MNDHNLNDDWIDKVRIEIYEETKDMSKEEILDYFRKIREEIVKKYNFTFVESLD
jgi:hemerythrin-like domain-containing protein